MLKDRKKLAIVAGAILLIGIVSALWLSKDDNELVGRWEGTCGVQVMDIKEDMTAEFTYHGKVMPGKLEKRGDNLYKFSGWEFSVEIKNDELTAHKNNGTVCKYKRSK